MGDKEKYTSRKIIRDSLPMLGAIFIAIASVCYIMFKSWSNKIYVEKWKDYDECGI